MNFKCIIPRLTVSRFTCMHPGSLNWEFGLTMKQEFNRSLGYFLLGKQLIEGDVLVFQWGIQLRESQ